MTAHPETVPVIVVEGPADQFDHAVREVAAAGWTLVRGWGPPSELGATTPAGDAARPLRSVVCSGQVTCAEEAAAAVSALVDGAGILVRALASRDVLSALCDDLRHLGPLDHRVGQARVVIDDEERRLLDALVSGASVVSAARAAYLSRRTVERRLTRLRDRFAVKSTAELLVAHRAQFSLVPLAAADAERPFVP